MNEINQELEQDHNFLKVFYKSYKEFPKLLKEEITDNQNQFNSGISRSKNPISIPEDLIIELHRAVFNFQKYLYENDITRSNPTHERETESKIAKDICEYREKIYPGYAGYHPLEFDPKSENNKINYSVDFLKKFILLLQNVIQVNELRIKWLRRGFIINKDFALEQDNAMKYETVTVYYKHTEQKQLIVYIPANKNITIREDIRKTLAPKVTELKDQSIGLKNKLRDFYIVSDYVHRRCLRDPAVLKLYSEQKYDEMFNKLYELYRTGGKRKWETQEVIYTDLAEEHNLGKDMIEDIIQKQKIEIVGIIKGFIGILETLRNQIKLYKEGTLKEDLKYPFAWRKCNDEVFTTPIDNLIGIQNNE